MIRSKKYKSLVGMVPLGAIVSASIVVSTSCGASPVVLEKIEGDGESGRMDTTQLFITTNRAISHLTTNDIRFSIDQISAKSIAYETTDNHTLYTIQVKGNWQNNTTTQVSLTKHGYSIKNTLSITLWKDTTEHIRIEQLDQKDGESNTQTTTGLIFQSSKFNLSIDNIKLSNSNISMDTLTYNENTKRYSFNISGDWENGESISMTIDEIQGITIENKTEPITIYKDTTKHVDLENLEQVGGIDGETTTTGLKFKLTSEVGLVLNDITFTNSDIDFLVSKIEHVPESLDYIIYISGNWANLDQTGIIISKEGYTINTNDQIATLYVDTTNHIVLTQLEQVDGESKKKTTTTLNLSSDEDFGLTLDKISFDNALVSATQVEYDTNNKLYRIKIEPASSAWPNETQISLIIGHIDGLTIVNKTPKVTIYTDTTIYVTITNLKQIGGIDGVAGTTSLTFESTRQFELNPDDIVFTNLKVSPNIISYSGLVYTITISGDWTNGESTNISSITIEGYDFDVSSLTPVSLYKDSTTHVTIDNFQQIGGVSGTATTTALSFHTSVEIIGLTIDNILFPHPPGVIKASNLIYDNSTQTYTFNIAGGWLNGSDCGMGINAPSGYTINNNTEKITVYYDETTHVDVRNLISNGDDGTETTTKILWQLHEQNDNPLSDNVININNVTIDTIGSTQVNKEELYYDHDLERYVLIISGTWNNLDTITIDIKATGFSFEFSKKQVTLYKDITTHIKILGLSCDGMMNHEIISVRTSHLYIEVSDISKWNMSWNPDNVMKFTINETRVFVGKGITMTKNTSTIQINLTDAAIAEFSPNAYLTFEMLPISGYTITGGPLTIQVF